jgi:hypothetical protein
MPNNRTLTHSLKENDTTAPSRQRATRSSRVDYSIPHNFRTVFYSCSFVFIRG